MTKKRMFLLCGAIILIIIIVYKGCFLSYKNNFDNSIYVVTMNEENNAVSYYEVNDREYKRKIDKFEYENNEIVIFENCFDSYVDRVENKVLNKLSDNCKVIDANGNEIDKDYNITNIINEISKLEHNIINTKVIKTEKKYYVVVELNVNWWSPYDLYKYDQNELIYLYTFDGEDVIGIREK